MNERVLTHLDDDGRARMVDVGDKSETGRSARAEARVRVGPDVMARLAATGGLAKGDVEGTARLAGIMAAKSTASLIPMCHPLALDRVAIDIRREADTLVIEAEVGCRGRTGVEMEAMTAAAVAALTVYDMCKSSSKGIVIEHVRLLEKTGGKSGTWRVPVEGRQP